MRRPTSLRPAPRVRLLAALAAATLVGLAGAGCGGATPVGSPAPPGSPTPAGSPAPGPSGESGSPAQSDEVTDALAFTGTTVAGQPFDAAELAGEPAVLWFWAPWCPTCHNKAPDVLAAAEQVTVVGVGGLDQDSAMPGFIDRTGTGALVHLSDPDGQVWRKFEVVSQDTYVLIDAAGEVVFNGSLGGGELRDRAATLAGG